MLAEIAGNESQHGALLPRSHAGAVVTSRLSRPHVSRRSAGLLDIRPRLPWPHPLTMWGRSNALLEVEQAAIYTGRRGSDTAHRPAGPPCCVTTRRDRARRDVIAERIRALKGNRPPHCGVADPVVGSHGTADIVAVELACVQGVPRHDRSGDGFRSRAASARQHSSTNAALGTRAAQQAKPRPRPLRHRAVGVVVDEGF